MAFGRGFMDDPFFRESGMPPMMMQPDPFFRQRAAESNQRSLALRPHHPFGLMPFGGGGLFPSVFGGHDPFSSMERMMAQHANMAAGPGGGANHSSSFSSSSSVFQYSSSGGGRGGDQPQVYHATSSTQQAPGGITETRRSVRDSESGLQKVAIGHHLGDRSHTIERKFNARTKEREEHQELINLDETEAGEFDSEWKERTSQVMAVGGPSGGGVNSRRRRGHLADSRGIMPAPQTSSTATGVNGKRRIRPSSLSEEQLEDSDLFIVEEHKPPHQSTAGPSSSHHPHHPHRPHNPPVHGHRPHNPPHPHSSNETSSSAFTDHTSRHKSTTAAKPKPCVVIVEDDDDREEERDRDRHFNTVTGPSTAATAAAAAAQNRPGRGLGTRHSSEGAKRHTKQKKVHF